MREIGSDTPGKHLCLLGNEAIARGAIEAGVKVATAYPGTPSTEILETIASVAKELGIHSEWSTNEKVAFEVAVGASISGSRAMTSMKHAGMNWISDPLSTVTLSGIDAGLVIVTADDPGAHSSANEQDSRFYGMLAEIPVLEPSNPQEAKEMATVAFELSERIKLPIILRSVTRLGHVRGDVTLGRLPRPESENISKVPEPERFWVGAQSAVQRHIQRHEDWTRVEELMERLPFNKLETGVSEALFIITSGVAYGYAKEALQKLKDGDKVGILKIGGVYPIPKKLVKKALEAKTVLVVEEGEPFLELQIRAFTADLESHSSILGKTSGNIPIGGELTTEKVLMAISKLLNGTYPSKQKEKDECKRLLLPRSLTLCPGCPHSATFFALKRTLKRVGKKETVVCGDIGCYALSILPPYELGNVKYSMGASIGVAAGLSQVTKYRTIALIGDSTFFHAGIPALINAVYNNHKFIIIVMDNMTTGMTGGQPHPGVGINAAGEIARQVLIEDLARACGVDFVEVVDSYNVQKLSRVIERAFKFDGLALIVSRRLCALEAKKRKTNARFEVNQEQCKDCGTCMQQFACAAIGKSDGRTVIDSSLCMGCGVCQSVCPFDAIVENESV